MTTRFYHPIIVGKKHLPIAVRLRDTVLTILLWWMYVYFMQDLFFFISDVAHWTWHGFANPQDYKTFAILPTFLSYVEVMGIFVVIYIGWALYNQVRFQGKNRRRTVIPVKPEDLAHFYRLETQQVESFQHARTLTIYHDNKGHIIKVK